MAKKCLVIALFTGVFLILFGSIKSLITAQNKRISGLETSINRVDLSLTKLGVSRHEAGIPAGVKIEDLVRQVETVKKINLQLRQDFDKFSNFEGKADVFMSRMLAPTVQIRYKDRSGAGVIMKKERANTGLYKVYVLTAYHIVSDAKEERAPNRIYVNIYKGDKKFSHIADIFRHDDELDIAILSVETDIDGLNCAIPIQPARRSSISLYDPVVTIGCPLGYDPIATEGRITSFRKKVKGGNFWLMSSPTVYGNSGGGVFLKKTGELIGIANMICTYDGVVSTPVYHMSIFMPIMDICKWLDSEGISFLYKDEHSPGATLMRR